MSATQELLSSYQHVIEDVRLVTGSKGVFDVRVDGELVFSKHQAGRHAKPGEVLARFVEQLEPGVRRYGT